MATTTTTTTSIRTPTPEELAVYLDKLSPEVDMVNSPSHYTSGVIECIDYIEDLLTYEELQGYLRGCMIKYQHRLLEKGSPMTNLEKLLWYGERLRLELM
jgi:hypothetical protein